MSLRVQRHLFTFEEEDITPPIDDRASELYSHNVTSQEVQVEDDIRFRLATASTQSEINFILGIRPIGNVTPLAQLQQLDRDALHANGEQIIDALYKPKRPPAPETPVPVTHLHGVVCNFIDFEASNKIDVVPTEFMCPLSLLALRAPMCASDGNVYEKTFLDHLHLVAKNKHEPLKSPTTRQVIFNEACPCIVLVALMERWVRSYTNIADGVSLEDILLQRLSPKEFNGNC